MPSQRNALIAVATSLISLQGCLATDLPHCVSRADLLSADTQTSNVIVGVPAERLPETPYVTISRKSNAASVNALQLKLIPASVPWPTDLDESSCKGLDWRTFRVEVERDSWEQFWTPTDPPQVSLAIGLSDSGAPLQLNRFAFALVGGETSTPLISFGCYWAQT